MFGWYLTVQSQQNDHDKETHGPHLRHGHHGYSTWVDDECQTWTYMHAHEQSNKVQTSNNV